MKSMISLKIKGMWENKISGNVLALQWTSFENKKQVVSFGMKMATSRLEKECKNNGKGWAGAT